MSFSFEVLKRFFFFSLTVSIKFCQMLFWVSWASLVAQRLKRLPAMWETRVRPLGWEDSPGEGNGNPLQYSCLENPMDGGAWWATVHGVAKSQTRLSDFTSLHFPSYNTGFPFVSVCVLLAWPHWFWRLLDFFLSVFCPRSGISHFSKELWSETMIWSPKVFLAVGLSLLQGFVCFLKCLELGNVHF